MRKEADVIAMTTLAILLMPDSYDCPLVKSLISMPNMTTLYCRHQKPGLGRTMGMSSLALSPLSR